MESKPFYLSKTFWSNALLLVVLPMLPDSAKAFLTAENVAYLFAGINILLRLITKDKVTLLP